VNNGLRCAVTSAIVFVLAASVLLRGSSTTLFRDVAAGSGLRFQHVNGASGQFHLPEIMGAGGALFDYDGDGDLDVLLLQGTILGHSRRPDDRSTPRLFRNDLKPRVRESLHFTDVTAGAGFTAGDYGMGVAVGDYDNDGDPDLYLTNVGANRLYRNDGGGRFTDVTRKAGDGLDDPRWSTSASFTDYDADGALDLFVTNYVEFSVNDNKICSDPTGVRDYCGPLQFRPVPDRLFRNNGDGTFIDVTEKTGITAAYGAGLGVIGADLDGDGRQDFYVANDASANQFWRNRGDGTFEEVALLAGLAFNAEGQPEGSMGIAFGDPDEDGDFDLVVTNITGESHAFYRNQGHGQFDDHRQQTRLGILTRPYTGFGTGWFDADNDGHLDLFSASGAVTMLNALRGEPFPFHQKNQLFRFAADRFEDVTTSSGPALALDEVSRGAAFGDVDNDGDVDVLVTNNNGPVRLLLNDCARPDAGFSVRLQGVHDNRDGLGARVGLQDSNGVVRWRSARTDGSYLSSSDPRVHFAVPEPSELLTLIVEWPRGSRESWKLDRANFTAVLNLTQGKGSSISPLHRMALK
jgi:enediyne biosynthesis protein E4